MPPAKPLTALSPYNSPGHIRQICDRWGIDYDTLEENARGAAQLAGRRVTLYDSTLRDGEQMPGVSFTPDQKLRIAQSLDAAGVPQIEAGFPAVSASEREAIRRIADAGLKADILVLTRLRREDIDMAVDSGADTAMIFVATSALHLRYKLRCSGDRLLQRMEDCLQYAVDRGLCFSFSTEDTSRTGFDFLKEVYETAAGFPVKRLGITDTTGCISPGGMSGLVGLVRHFFPGHDISVHCHNDFGLALSNAIAGVGAGASAVTTTIGGIGERAGNVPLEQVAMALEHLYGASTGVDTRRFCELASLVSGFTGRPVPANQPFIGRNVFAHESGIHVAAVLRNPLCYECVAPGLVGNRQEIILGKHSGETVVKVELDKMGVRYEQEQLAAVVAAVKSEGERRGRLGEADFREIVQRVLGRGE